MLSLFTGFPLIQSDLSTSGLWSFKWSQATCWAQGCSYAPSKWGNQERGKKKTFSLLLFCCVSQPFSCKSSEMLLFCFPPTPNHYFYCRTRQLQTAALPGLETCIWKAVVSTSRICRWLYVPGNLFRGACSSVVLKQGGAGSQIFH
jgi:hypothetical protein